MGSKAEEVARALRALSAETAQHSGFPMHGFFSTLDELLQRSPNKMPGTQWANYLSPGKTITRGGRQFGLTADELRHAGLDFNLKLRAPGSFTREEMLDALRSTRSSGRQQFTPLFYSSLRSPLRGALDELNVSKDLPPQIREIRPTSYGRFRTPGTKWAEDVVTSSPEPQITRLSQMPRFSTHFMRSGYDSALHEPNYDYRGISWTRQNVLPKLGRLVDEIQSDVHQQNPQRTDVPFSGNAWINHELRKAMMMAAQRGESSISLVDPSIVGGRYQDNPGLQKFYEGPVTNAWNDLARRYGLDSSYVNKTIPTDLDYVRRLKQSRSNLDMLQGRSYSGEDGTRRMLADSSYFKEALSRLDPDILSPALRQAKIEHDAAEGALRTTRVPYDEARRSGQDDASLVTTWENTRDEYRNTMRSMMQHLPEVTSKLDQLIRNQQRTVIGHDFNRILLPEDARESIMQSGVPLYRLGGLAQKYASGGQVQTGPIQDMLKTVKAAMAHLEVGDKNKAAAVLAADPHALKHPQLAAIHKRMTTPKPAPPAPFQIPSPQQPIAGAPPVQPTALQGMARGGRMKTNVRKMLVKQGQTTSGPIEVPIHGLTQNRVLNEDNVNGIQKAITDGKEMNPVVIDVAGNILDGNHRVEAARRLGISHVDAHVIHDKGQSPGFQGGGSVKGITDAFAMAREPQQTTSPSILSSLTQGVQQLNQKNPMGSRVLAAHAQALLRAHLNAARSLHRLTGSTAGYQSLGTTPAQDPMAQYGAMNQLGAGSQPPTPGASPLAMAPLAVQAARQATGQQ